MPLLSDAKVELVRTLPLFEHCSRKELARIVRIATERTVPAGTTLMSEGEPGDSFFVVVAGEIEVRRKRRRVGRLGTGSFVGEIALLSRRPRAATVTAETALRLLEIGGADFVALLDDRPELWLKVARTLADRVEADEATEPPAG